jgi:Uri superfamily endonuclease
MTGAYLLLLRLDRPESVEVGRLGRFDFPPGYYVYAGSALGPGGLPARLARHQRRGKKRHWHVDYLREVAELVGSWSALSTERLECVWAGSLAAMGGTVVARGFGSSDCRCESHLLYFASAPDAAAIDRLVLPPAAGASPAATSR